MQLEKSINIKAHYSVQALLWPLSTTILMAFTCLYPWSHNQISYIHKYVYQFPFILIIYASGIISIIISILISIVLYRTIRNIPSVTLHEGCISYNFIKRKTEKLENIRNIYKNSTSGEKISTGEKNGIDIVLPIFLMVNGDQSWTDIEKYIMSWRRKV